MMARLFWAAAIAVFGVVPAHAWDAICNVSDFFSFDLKSKKLVEPTTNEFARDLLNGIRAATFPKRFVISYNRDLHRGSVMVQGGVGEGSGEALSVYHDEKSLYYTVHYRLKGNIESLTITRDEGSWRAYQSSLFPPSISVARYECVVED